MASRQEMAQKNFAVSQSWVDATVACFSLEAIIHTTSLTRVISFSRKAPISSILAKGV